MSGYLWKSAKPSDSSVKTENRSKVINVTCTACVSYSPPVYSVGNIDFIGLPIRQAAPCSVVKHNRKKRKQIITVYELICM